MTTAVSPSITPAPSLCGITVSSSSSSVSHTSSSFSCIFILIHFLLRFSLIFHSALRLLEQPVSAYHYHKGHQKTLFHRLLVLSFIVPIYWHKILNKHMLYLAKLVQ